MSDPLNGVKPTLPPWPVRPVAPANRERETGRRKKPGTPPDDTDTGHYPGEDASQGPGEDNGKPTIDEYI